MKTSTTLTTLATTLTLLTMVAPAPTLAATTQQSLDASIANLYSVTKPMDFDAIMNVHMTERPVKKTTTAPLTGSARIHLNARLLSASKQTEGTLTLESFDMPMGSSIPMPIKLDSPISIEWKVLDKVAYLHIAKFPQSLIDMLKAQGVDVSSAIGPWVSLDSSSSDTTLPIPSMSTISTDASNAKSAFHLRVLRIEKKTIDANKHTILRLRVAPNQTDITREKNMELSAAMKMYSGKDMESRLERADAIKAINARYADLQKSLKTVQAVINLDATSNTIQRIEIAGTQSKPQQNCDWNDKANKMICTTEATQIFTYNVGINLTADSGAAVVAPANSQPLKDLIDAYLKTMQTPAASSTDM